MNAAIRTFINNYWILMILIVVKILLQYFVVNPVYELHRDEFLYLDQAFHPQAGYISVPPFTSWVSQLIFLLGGGLFWIRFFTALSGAITIIFAWLIVEELGGKITAKVLVSCLLIFSVLTRLNILLQPNTFEVLAWIAVFYFLIKYVHSNRPIWLFMTAAMIAVGFYVKYNTIFLLIGLLSGLILTVQRTIFTRRTLYIAALLCLALLLPNIIWQIQHRFPVIEHMKALHARQLVYVNRVDFLVDQLKFGLIGIPTLLAFWALIFYKPFRPYRFVGWTYVVAMLLYLLCRAKNYYAVGLYPVLFALGSVYIEAISKRWRSAVVSALIVISIAIFFTIAKFIMPIPSPEEINANHNTFEQMGLLRWEDGENHQLPQDFADMLGWKEMADIAYKAWVTLPDDEKSKTLIFTDNYGQVGALNYYNRKRMPKAYSFNTDYLFWFPDVIQLQNMVFVGGVSDEICSHFKECILVGEVKNEYARERGTTVYQLLGADDSTATLIHQLVKERRANFDCF